MSQEILPDADHVRSILHIDISEKHIPIDISLKRRIGNLVEIDDGLFIISISIIGYADKEFIKRCIGSIEISKF